MKREIIDDDVWDHVAENYAELFTDRCWCDALRRALGLRKLETPTAAAAELPPQPRDASVRSTRKTEKRLNRNTDGRNFSFSFGDAPRRTFRMPEDKGDKKEIRKVRDAAMAFGQENRATPGQMNAIAKAFSDAGYYLTGPR
jgi:hypothetical protein